MVRHVRVVMVNIISWGLVGISLIPLGRNNRVWNMILGRVLIKVIWVAIHNVLFDFGGLVQRQMVMLV